MISVITPTLGRPELERCKASVRAQTYGPVEHIIELDDPPSNDWGVTPRLKAIARSRGALVGYCDDDNAWRPAHLEKLSLALTATGADFAYSRAYVHGEAGDYEVGVDPPVHGGIDTSLILHRRELLEVATWRGAGYSCDWDLVSRWLEAGATWAFVPEITLDYYASAPMRLIVGHTGAQAHAETLEALEGYPATYHRLRADTDYVDLLERTWGEGWGFILVEHDIVPWKGALEELWACSEPWCAFEYPYLQDRGDTVHAGLGCCRFGRAILRAVPDAIREAGEFGDDIHPQRHWCSFDSRLSVVLLRAGFKVHVHRPPVGHLNPHSSAHGCIEAQHLVEETQRQLREHTWPEWAPV